MTLILVKNKRVLDMPSLTRAILKSIYEPTKFTNEEMDLMMHSIVDWKNHLDYKRDIGFNAVDNENKICLEYLADMLDKDSRGEFDSRKEMFRLKGISWQKFHRLPEAYSPIDFIKAKFFHSQLPKEEQ